MILEKGDYNEVLELLRIITEDMEHDQREESTRSCGGYEYEYVDIYQIDKTDFDMNKAEALYEKLKNLRKDKIEKIIKEL